VEDLMKRILAAVVSIAIVLSAGSSYAMQRGNGGGPKTKSGPTMKSGPATKGGGAPKVHAQGGPKSQGGPKMKTASAGPKARTSGTTASAGKTKGPKATTAKATTTTSTTKTAKATTTTTGGDGTVTLTPVQQKLQRNTKLASKLESRLPKGTDLMTAAEGFRNLGQFVAAVNVSNNLGIPFADLKTRMVDDGMSLGQAIKLERPSADATTEARRAQTDAERVIATTGPVTTKKTKGGQR
jgi:hypothetical protein